MQAPTGTTFDEGTEVTLLGVCNDVGYAFSHWSGDINSSESTIKVQMAQDMNIVANFVTAESKLTHETIPADVGFVLVNPDDSIFPRNSTVEVLAGCHDTNYYFDRWTSGITGSTPQQSVTLNSDKHIVAQFKHKHNKTFSLSTSPSTVGAVQNIPTGNIFLIGDEVAISATAADGEYEFSHWSGAFGNHEPFASTEPEASVTILHDMNLVANYVIPPANGATLHVSTDPSHLGGIMTETGESGSLIRMFNGGKRTVSIGTTVEVMGLAGVQEYEFTHWSGDLDGTNYDTSILVDSDKHITAHFKAIVTGSIVADAGFDRTVTDWENDGFGKIMANGSASFSENNHSEITSYVWSYDNEEIAHGVTGQLNLPVGIDTVTLTITDSEGKTATDTVVITVNAVTDALPKANAGPDVVKRDADASGDETISLSMHGSYDVDGTIESILWRLGEVVIGTDSICEYDFPVGRHKVTVTVEDNAGNHAADYVMVDVVAHDSEQKDTVAIIVDNAVYDAVSEEIDTYMADVSALFPVALKLYRYGDTPEEEMNFLGIREFLKRTHESDNITGAVLVGFFPVMSFQGYYNTYGDLIGYEDILGSTFEIEESGKFHRYVWDESSITDELNNTQNRELEIWISLMRPNQSKQHDYSYTPDVIVQLKGFLNKCHAYYEGDIVVPEGGLLFANIDWAGEANPEGATYKSMAKIFGDKLSAFGGYGGGEQYLDSVSRGHQLTYMYSHSGSGVHMNPRGPRAHLKGSQWQPDLQNNIGRNSAVTMISACNGANIFDECGGNGQESISLTYANAGVGMACLGFSKSIAFHEVEVMFNYLSEGDYLGKAYHKYKSYVLQSFGRYYAQYNDHSGTNGLLMLGNPFIKMNYKASSAVAAASLSGTVRQASGQPAVKSQVTLFRNDSLITTAYSDNYGNYSMNALDAGAYVLRFISDRGVTLEKAIYLSEGEEKKGICASYLETNDIVPLHDKWFYVMSDKEENLPLNWSGSGWDNSLNVWTEAVAPFTSFADPNAIETNINYNEALGHGPQLTVTVPVGRSQFDLCIEDTTKKVKDYDRVYVTVFSEAHEDVEYSEYYTHAPGVIADAGPDMTLIDSDGDGYETVVLDGSNSISEGGTINGYMWSCNNNLICMRNEFTLTDAKDVVLNISADNGVEAYLNGQKIIANAGHDVRPERKYWNISTTLPEALLKTDGTPNSIVIMEKNMDGGRYLDAMIYQVAPAQEKYTISGYVKAFETGEAMLPSCVDIRYEGPLSGTILTDENGYYEVVLPSGEYQFIYAGRFLHTAEGGEDIRPISVTDGDLTLGTIYLAGDLASGTQPPFQWLCDLPIQSATAEVKHNTNFAGTAISIAGEPQPKGLTTKGFTQITYAIDGTTYDWFTAVIGRDDYLSKDGNASFEVLVDGVSRYKSGTMRKGEKEHIAVPVSGASEVTLITSTSENDLENCWAVPFLSGETFDLHKVTLTLVGKESGLPIEGARVRWSGTFAGEKLTDENGKVVVSLPNGSYRTRVYHPDCAASGNAFTIENSDGEYIVECRPRPEYIPTYLSYMTPIKSNRTFRSNKSIDNNTISIGDTTFNVGLGSHAYAEATYDLGGAYEYFTAVVGRDNESQQDGSVQFLVIGDGVELYKSPIMRNGDSDSIDVSVAGVQELTIIANDGGDGDSWDHVSWGDAKLYKDNARIYSVSGSVVRLADNTPVGNTVVTYVSDKNEGYITSDAAGNFQVDLGQGLYEFATLSNGKVGMSYMVYVDQTIHNINLFTPTAEEERVWLSDLHWTHTDGHPKKDKSYDNNSIIINGVTYVKGLGMHSYSVVEFDVPSAFDTFHSFIGRDDESQGDGLGQFEVLLDGESVFMSELIARGTLAEVNVPLNGASKITLVAHKGDGSDSWDHLDWANAAFIKSNDTLFTLSGTVLDLQKQPVENVSVYINGLNEAPTFTDADGLFSDRVSPGEYSITLIADGFNAKTESLLLARDSDITTYLSTIYNNTWVSDLPFTQTTGSVRKDASNDGREISLQGTVYEKGIGMHTYADATFSVDQSYDTFSAIVGRDDECLEDGNVRFEVWSGDTRIYYGRKQRQADIDTITIPVGMWDELTLVSDAGNDGDSWDHVDWAAAKVTALDFDTCTISGTVVSDAGAPVANAHIGYGGTIEGSLVSDANGLFTIVVPTGPCSLYVSSDEYLSTKRVLLITDDVSSLEIALEAAATPTYLSDMFATSSVGDIRFDRSHEGGTMTLNGVTYNKGIAMHAPAEIIYDLNGGYDIFKAALGRDDESVDDGMVQFHLFADGVEIYTSPLLSNLSDICEIAVPVQSVNELKLVISDGGDGNGWDHAEWADARVLELSDEQYYTISGSVLAQGSNESLANATIEYDGPLSGVISADASGLFTASLPLGVYTFEVTTADFYHAPVTIVVDTTVSGITLVATPQKVTTWLSDLNWEYSRNNVRRDRSIDGNPITIGGVMYEKGLGMHAPMEVRYTLNGEYIRLTGIVGRDDECLEDYNSQFVILADGSEVFRSNILRNGESQALNLDLTNVTSLTLVAEGGGDGTSWDHLDWADMQLKK